MLSQQDNELITRTGPGTPMGEYLRRFWVPALLARELPEPDCPPVRVKIMSEELVAFRDTNGDVGLVDNYCPHRRASLFFGRNEECGIRCVYHGWKFDVNGDCVDMPSEPAESNFKDKVKIKSYPARDWAASSGRTWVRRSSCRNCRRSAMPSCRRATAGCPVACRKATLCRALRAA